MKASISLGPTAGSEGMVMARTETSLIKQNRYLKLNSRDKWAVWARTRAWVEGMLSIDRLRLKRCPKILSFSYSRRLPPSLWTNESRSQGPRFMTQPRFLTRINNPLLNIWCRSRDIRLSKLGRFQKRNWECQCQSQQTKKWWSRGTSPPM